MGEVLQGKNSDGLDAHGSSAAERSSSKFADIKSKKQGQPAQKCDRRYCSRRQQPDFGPGSYGGSAAGAWRHFRRSAFGDSRFCLGVVIRDILDRREPAVSAARKSLNKVRVLGGIAKSVAKFIDGDIHAVVEVHKGVVRPQPLLQLFPRHQLAGTLGK